MGKHMSFLHKFFHSIVGVFFFSSIYRNKQKKKESNCSNDDINTIEYILIFYLIKRIMFFIIPCHSSLSLFILLYVFIPCFYHFYTSFSFFIPLPQLASTICLFVCLPNRSKVKFKRKPWNKRTEVKKKTKSNVL